jgi:hypothetical protein
MKKTEFESAQIDELLKTLRGYNNEIGSYEQHLILTDDCTYSIKLTNGSIRIYTEELQDMQALLHDRLKDIAARFRERK